jgi:hypothetical protein
MTNITSLSTYRASTLPTAAPQQSGNTITLQQALATNASPASLRAVADWNERRGYDERRRKVRARHKAQCMALREVANQLEASNGTELHREAA